MKKIKQYIDSRKEALRKQEENNLKSEFKVTERKGRLWLTHNGVAFMEIQAKASAETITTELNKARNAAMEYAML